MKETGGYTRDAKELAIMQSYPLWMKVMLTKQRIREWVYQFGEDSVVVSFSGGKDSTVLLHLVREEFPNVRAVFSNTGLEYPEIQRFVKSFDNVDIVTPKMRFDEVISTYGYPLIGKEVAEAIYYARRIRNPDEHANRREALSGNLEGRSQDVNVERESRTSVTKYKRTELRGERTKRYSVQDGSLRGSELETSGNRGGRIAGERRSTVRSRQTRASTDNDEPG